MLIRRLAETLVAKEKASGLTRKAFAKHLGLPVSSYRVIVGGDAKVTLERVALLAAALKVSEFEILGVVPSQSAPGDLVSLTSVRNVVDLR